MMGRRHLLGGAAWLAGGVWAGGLLRPPPGRAAAAADVGVVERARREVTGINADGVRPLAASAAVLRNDTVETGAGARAELRLIDATSLTIGERARVEIDEFILDEGGSTLLTLARGALRYTSGTARKIAGREIRLVTPAATIGIRGTDFWVGPIEGGFGVLLLDGLVEVANGAGSVVLDEPREGTLILGPGVAPEEPSVWPADRRARALATVAF